MLRENEVLTSLLLEDCGLGPEGLCEMCNAVGMNTTLTSLHLSGNEFDDQSIACLGKLLIIHYIASNHHFRTLMALTLAQFQCVILHSK